MAIAFDAVAEGTAASFNHTCTGLRRLLFVCTIAAPATPVTAVTYNGVSLTQIGSGTIRPSNAEIIQVWYLVAPASGTNSVAITGGGSLFDATSISYTGCDPSTIPDAVHSTSTSASLTVTETITTVAANCWALFFISSGSIPVTGGTGTTQRRLTGILGGAIYDSGGALAPGSQSMSASAGLSTNWASVMLSFAPNVAAAFAASATFGFATSPALRGVPRFAAASTFGFSTTGRPPSGVSRFAASAGFGFSTSPGFVTVLRPPRDTAHVSFVVNGVDVTTLVEKYESEITETQNQGAAQATIVVRGITPVEGQIVTITDTLAGITLFAGQIVALTVLQRHVGMRVSYRLDCDQWGKLFDRRLVHDVITNAANTDVIVESLVTQHTSGFTTANVQGLLRLVAFPVSSGETMTSCVQRLATLVDAVFRILPSKDVYFRTTTNLSAPATLDTTHHYRDFSYKREIRQIATRVYAKGATVTIPADVGILQLAVPLESIAPFASASMIILNGLKYNASLFQSGGIGTTLSAGASAGATSLSLTSTINFTTTGWALVNGVYVYWTGKTGGTPGTLTGIPSTGPGSLSSDMPSGASIVTVPSVLGINLQQPIDGLLQLSTAIIPAGSIAQLVVQRDDLAAQAALAVKEGGDGIHEFEVEDTSIAIVLQLQVLGDAELALSKNVIETATFVSEDSNAQVGAMQAIALPTVTTTLPITTVRIYWMEGRGRPQREVTAATIEKTFYQFLADLYNQRSLPTVTNT